jgi:hypothetical protein
MLRTRSIAHRLKDFLPNHPKKIYAPIGNCIYCSASNNLNDEHIIPFGLGGRMELPKSSCPECSSKTSIFEHTCLRTMYGPLRLLYDLPSRRKKSRPKTLPLKVKFKPNEEWSKIQVVQDRYPFLITFPYFSMPNLLTESPSREIRGAVTNRLWIRGASPSYVFKDLLQKLTLELNACSIMPESKAHVEEFCQMLAKIGYSFAVAELGYGNFKPFLIPHIINKDLSNCSDYIGSLSKDESPSDQLHELSIHKNSNPNYVTVRIRLFAKLGTPTYYVVVGQRLKN